jgi:broad specificity phosphatase PhoE
VPELREHRFSPKPLPNWREVLTQSWHDLDAAPGGGETLRATQERGLAALGNLCARHPGGTIAIGGHGTIFACILRSVLPSVDCAFLVAMPMPAMYELRHHPLSPIPIAKKLVWSSGPWSILSGPGIGSSGGVA